MKKQIIFVFLLLVSLILLVSCTNQTSVIKQFVCSDGSIVDNASKCIVPQTVQQPLDNVNKDITKNENLNKQEPTVIENKFEPIVITGQGKSVSKKFELGEGLVTFKIKNTGSSNFVVKFYDPDGNYELLANEIGSFNGMSALGVQGGNYIFDVDSSGSWEIDVDQPKIDRTETITQFSGKGKSISNFFNLNSGIKIINMQNTGSSNFVVKLLDKDGNYVELLANEIGSFKGSKVINIEQSGIYLFDIDSNGNWVINIEEPQ